MAAPLDGIRVLEVANWLAAPAATALMADLGADVIKVEPPEGDVFRGFMLRAMGYDFSFQANYAFELDNRGKRSVAVALDKPGGPELVRRLAQSADIFLTNLVQRRRVRYGLTEPDLRSVNPKLVYVSFSGYGARGPDADRPGFDYAAFWAASGIMGLMGEPDAPPPLCRGGQGDHTTALNILAATLAALRMRDTTGQGQHVETTLQASGMWTIAGDYAAALVSKMDAPRISRSAPTNPIWNSYRCADGEWVLLVNPTPFPRHWPAFAHLVDRPEWATDERYDDIMKLRTHTQDLTRQIDEIFAGHDAKWWAAKLDESGLVWAPVARVTEVIDSPQVREMGWIESVEHPELGSFETLGVPFKVYGSDTKPRGPAPDVGQHTFDVLSELGLSEDEVNKLAADGVLG